MLFPMLSVLYFYFHTFWSIYTVRSLAFVSCSFMLWFTGMCSFFIMGDDVQFIVRDGSVSFHLLIP
jgi:hypothetical protein